MLRKYLKNTSGNFAAIFAVCLLMIMVAVGAAVDYNGMTRQQAKYQSLADTAVLAAARSGESRKGKLKKAMMASLNEHDIDMSRIRPKLILKDNDRIQVKITGKYDTVLMGLFGKKEAEVDVVAESLLGVNGYVNVALVLDVTGSMMANGKLDALKTAATDMITKMEGFENDRLNIAVVPFAQYVNVGLGNRNASWINVPPDWTETFPQTCSTNTPVTSSTVVPGSCTTSTYPPTPPTPPSTCYSTNDGVTTSYSCGGSSGSRGGTRTSCSYTYTYGAPVTTCTTPPPVVHTWHGCVGSRLDPRHKRVAAGASNPVPGFLDLTCNQALLPLTNDLTKVKANIASLTAVGDTYMPAGLMWGWRTLDARAPFTEASATSGENVRNIVIFMTDGLNSKSKNGELHDNTDRDGANNVTKTICNKIKAKEIEIYSVAYELFDNNAKRIVRKCATDNTMFYNADNARELKKAFKDIGKSMLSPRLTH